MTLPPTVTVDASVVVKWFAVTETLSDQALALLQLHLDQTLRIEILPLTSFEVGNAALSRGGSELARAALEAMDGFALSVQQTTLDIALEAASLADHHGLTYYDASYLASALARDAPLVTDDIALLGAARSEGVGIALDEVPLGTVL